MVRGADGPIGKSARAWALVIGGMIVVAIVNVIIGYYWFVPSRGETGWEDAAVPAQVQVQVQPADADASSPTDRR